MVHLGQTWLKFSAAKININEAVVDEKILATVSHLYFNNKSLHLQPI
jgi:hypothetical protein